MELKVRAVAFLGLVARGHFSHGVVGRRATMLRVRLHAIPLDHQDHPTRVFDAGEESYPVGAGIIRLLQEITENLDVFVALSGATCWMTIS
jgi:hypothetical protein